MRGDGVTAEMEYNVILIAPSSEVGSRYLSIFDVAPYCPIKAERSR